ncbi:MAG: AMP-binding protein [Maribacter sp.]
MKVDDGFIHSKFSLNGNSYDKTSLKELSYDFIKEGSTFEKSVGNFLSGWLNEKTTLKVKTSGSTGTPKDILLQKQRMVNSALATGDYFNLKEGNTALLCLPTDYIAGKMMLIRAMVLGLKLDYVEPSSSPLMASSNAYDFVAMVPLQLENSLDKIENINTLIVGGAAMSQSLKEKVQNKSTAVFETYGMTETITHVAVKRINAVLSSAVETSSTARTNSKSISFKAIPNVLFSKDDRDCLVISAPKVSEHSVITNDVVNLVSNIEFELLGRYDNVINSGGIKLFPEQIEAKVASLLRNRFFVAGLPDEKLGQKLVLVVEGKIDSSKLMESMETLVGLEQFELPKNIYTRPHFIETNSGKIRRNENLRLIKG